MSELSENYVDLKQEFMQSSSKLRDEFLEKTSRLEQEMSEIRIKIKSLEIKKSEQDPGNMSECIQRNIRMTMKPPEYDGKTSWVSYLRQFEAAAQMNNWSPEEKATALTLCLRGDATEVIQTLSTEEAGDFQKLVNRMESRYGQAHLKNAYYSQLKNRYQKSNESLQDFEADIARLARLA